MEVSRASSGARKPQSALAYGLLSSVRLPMVRRLAAPRDGQPALAYDLPPEYVAGRTVALRWSARGEQLLRELVLEIP